VKRTTTRRAARRVRSPHMKREAQINNTCLSGAIPTGRIASWYDCSRYGATSRRSDPMITGARYPSGLMGPQAGVAPPAGSQPHPMVIDDIFMPQLQNQATHQTCVCFTHPRHEMMGGPRTRQQASANHTAQRGCAIPVGLIRRHRFKAFKA
jgi:hypothetical protein